MLVEKALRGQQLFPRGTMIVPNVIDSPSGELAGVFELTRGTLHNRAGGRHCAWIDSKQGTLIKGIFLHVGLHVFRVKNHGSVCENLLAAESVTSAMHARMPRVIMDPRLLAPFLIYVGPAVFNTGVGHMIYVPGESRVRITFDRHVFSASVPLIL